MICHQCINGYYKTYPATLCSLHKKTPEDVNMPEFAIKNFNTCLSAWHKQCFMVQCALGETSVDKIDDIIDEWHMSAEKEADIKLHIYLGMNEYEYELFLQDPDAAIKESVARWEKIINNSHANEWGLANKT